MPRFQACKIVLEFAVTRKLKVGLLFIGVVSVCTVIQIRNIECRVACQAKGYDSGFFKKTCQCVTEKKLEDLVDQTIKLPRKYIESQRRNEEEEY